MNMTSTDYYKKGFQHAIELIELMGNDDQYEEWSAMIADLKKIIENK